MTILTISAAAHAAGIDRRTLQRAIKSGRLSATANAAGERGIDLAELIRVFGPLREMPQEPPQGQSAAMSQDAPGGAAGAALVEALRDQVRQAQEQLRQAYEREQQAQQEKARLLALLEAEQQARRDLEMKLLPAPPPPQPDPPRRHYRVWLLLVILALAVAALVWTRTSAYWPMGG
jgi:hypothetical protein